MTIQQQPDQAEAEQTKPGARHLRQEANREARSSPSLTRRGGVEKPVFSQALAEFTVNGSQSIPVRRRTGGLEQPPREGTLPQDELEGGG